MKICKIPFTVTTKEDVEDDLDLEIFCLELDNLELKDTGDKISTKCESFHDAIHDLDADYTDVLHDYFKANFLKEQEDYHKVTPIGFDPRFKKNTIKKIA